MRLRTMTGPPVEVGDERQPMFDFADVLDDVSVGWEEMNFDSETKRVTMVFSIEECAALANWIGERA